MNSLRRAADYLIRKQYWVSLCAAGLAAYVQWITGAGQPVKSALIFFASLVIYNLNRASRWYVYYRENKLQKRRRALIREIPAVLFIGLSGCALLLFEIPPPELYVLAPAFTLSFFYSIPLYYSRTRYLLLREIAGAKLFLIALSWGLVTGVFPLGDYTQAWKAFGLVFSFILGIGIPFDIRDLVYDSPKLKTLPQRLGEKRAKGLALLCLLSSCGFLLALKPPVLAAAAYVVSIVVSASLVLGSSTRRSNFYYAFWVEGCSLLPLLLGLVFSFLS